MSDLSLGIALQIFQLSLQIFWGGEDEGPSYAFLSDLTIPWFMYALAEFEIILWVVRDIDKRKLLICSAVFTCFVGYDPSIRDLLQLSCLIVFLPFYLAGTMISPERLREKLRRRKIAAFIGAIVLLIWASACFKIPGLYSLRPLFTGRNPFSKRFLPYGALYRLACMSITSIASMAFLCIIPDRRLPVVTECGRRTLQVYFYHGLILEILWHYGVGPMLMDTPSGKLLWIFIGVAVALVSFTKFFTYPTRWLRF